MKYVNKFLLLLVFLLTLPAGRASQIEQSDPTKDLNRIRSLKDPRAISPPWTKRASDGSVQQLREPENNERALWYSQKEEQILELTKKFLVDHPKSPLRWEALAIAVTVNTPFRREMRGEDGKLVLTFDKSPRDAWYELERKLMIEAVRADDISPAVFSVIAFHAVRRYIGSGNSSEQIIENLRTAKAILDIWARTPNAADYSSSYKKYLVGLRKVDEQSYNTLVTQLAAHPDMRVAQMAGSLQRVDAMRTASGELKFVAIDGRQVDLASLRGKIVLLDFWATWCTPCIQEIPILKRVYEKYSKHGFEIIGISVDSESARGKFVTLCNTLGVTWPQHFDGKGPKTQLALDYAVTGVPATFLLDKNGLLVATGVRGEALEKEVRRLLGDPIPKN